jgi:hypothetical protein
MKSILGFCFVVIVGLVSCAHAAETSTPAWQVERLGSEVWATRADLKGLRVLLQPSGGGTPKILSWRESPVARGVWTLTYVAGEIGTTEPVLELRGVVIRLAERKVLVDEIFAYKNAEKPDEDLGAQPQWTWTSKMLLVERPDREKPVKIAL